MQAGPGRGAGHSSGCRGRGTLSSLCGLRSRSALITPVLEWRQHDPPLPAAQKRRKQLWEGFLLLLLRHVKQTVLVLLLHYLI